MVCFQWLGNKKEISGSSFWVKLSSSPMLQGRHRWEGNAAYCSQKVELRQTPDNSGSILRSGRGGLVMGPVGTSAVLVWDSRKSFTHTRARTTTTTCACRCLATGGIADKTSLSNITNSLELLFNCIKNNKLRRANEKKQLYSVQPLIMPPQYGSKESFATIGSGPDL